MAYLTLAEFIERTTMPRDDVLALESLENGYVTKRLEIRTSYINARLCKRYATPFGAPVLEIVLGWLTDLVTNDAHVKRSQNPSSEPQYAEFAQAAKDEIKEAADSKDGLFDLPLRQDTSTSGITKGAPLAYSEPDPYTWLDRQRERARCR